MEHFTKQSHYVRYPALELLCNSLFGPLTKKFGAPAIANDTILSETQSMDAKNFLVLVLH